MLFGNRKKNILEDLLSSVLSKFKKYHRSGKLKFNSLGILQSLKLRRPKWKKILRKCLRINFSPNTLGGYGLTLLWVWNFFSKVEWLIGWSKTSSWKRDKHISFAVQWPTSSKKGTLYLNQRTLDVRYYKQAFLSDELRYKQLLKYATLFTSINHWRSRKNIWKIISNTQTLPNFKSFYFLYGTTSQNQLRQLFTNEFSDFKFFIDKSHSTKTRIY